MTRNDGLKALLLALACALTSPAAIAFAAGAPICEVNSLPLMEMSPTLSDPPPSGWSLRSDRPVYVTGQLLTIRVHHADPGRRARGVLVWAKSGPFTGAGNFLFPLSGLYQFIPAPADCGEWAMSHTSSAPKSLSELEFRWLPPAGGVVIVRAFLIEDCGQPQGCRAYQALTPVLVLQEALFVDGFDGAQ